RCHFFVFPSLSACARSTHSRKAELTAGINDGRMGFLAASSATFAKISGSTRTIGHDATGFAFFRPPAIEVNMNSY
ncbi:MAG TPA: hypothetical protein VJ891_01145, partial [Casimicrobiaceae bacterium]|nr:hypothetical protein [Casimicrobiaceae bacterium]